MVDPIWQVALISGAVGVLVGWVLAKRSTPEVQTLRAEVRASEKAQRRQSERLRAILDAMSEAVLVTDAEGHIVLSNQVIKDLVGPDVEQKTAVEAIPHPDFHDALARSQEGVSSSLEFEIEAASGATPRALRVSVSPLRKRRGVVSVLYDVTQERAVERVRRDFVANAGHELRTPLTAIRGFAETLRSGAYSDPESAEHFLDVILRHTARLQTLVNDLAELSRFEGEELRLQRDTISPGAIIDEVVAGLEAHATAKNLQIGVTGDSGGTVVADARALEQVLINLVDNAIKYTPEGGEVRITVHDRPDRMAVDVMNTGPGIPEEQLARVFERFYRVDAGRSRELGGTGLGLSIVKHLLASMGGEIHVESEQGSWTRFELSLPKLDSPKSDTVVSQS